MAEVSIKVETQILDESGVDDELDHIPFQNRLKPSLVRQIDSDELQGEAKRPKMSLPLVVKKEQADGSLQEISAAMSSIMDDVNHQNGSKGTENSHLTDSKTPNSGNDFHEIAEDGNAANLSCLNHRHPQQGCDSENSLSPKFSNFLKVEANSDTCLGQAESLEYKSRVGQEAAPSDADNVHVSSLPTFLANVKVETSDSGSGSQSENTMDNSLKEINVVAVKSEVTTCGEAYEDVIDHMPLQERKELLLARRILNLDYSKNLKCLRKSLPSAADLKANFSETSKPEGRRRKRKKTATDSVETALEEDAPGLLKALVDKGILLDEIQLYGEDVDGDDAIDISSEEENFGDLEAVVSKLFTERSSFLKLGQLHSMKVSKPSYCLACLLSLIEQTRYLQFRKWPVEWGWCRDLQSFIFVFQRHNRIVMERPEYGYATYFFELVDSLTIKWQVKRLVTAMKLTACSRTTLIENKSLLVGEDLTEGEARVLEDYGWTPNTGLGSMLNFCDRVVHDRKNVEDVSEWRSKIGKQLMNGLDGGTITLPHLPKKFKGTGPLKEQTNQADASVEVELNSIINT